MLSVASRYAPLVAFAGLVFSALSRRTVLTIAAVLTLTATSVIQIPRYYFPRPDATHFADVRVFSGNLRKGQADPTSFVAMAKADADVIAVSELTPEAIKTISQGGLDAAFPYSVLYPAPGAGGIGLWSRYPLEAVSPGKHRHFAIAAARVKVPGVRLSPLVSSVHVFSPVSYQRDSVDGWQTSISDAREVLGDFAKAAGQASVIVAGDFNSTPDMQQFRELLTNGYRDTADQTGAGFVPTFPADSALPPVLAIDHVLTRRATATSLKATDVPGSDHRALLVTVRIPTMPAQTNDD